MTEDWSQSEQETLIPRTNLKLVFLLFLLLDDARRQLSVLYAWFTEGFVSFVGYLGACLLGAALRIICCHIKWRQAALTHSISHHHLAVFAEHWMGLKDQANVLQDLQIFADSSPH
jgi:hypothetical protein